MGLMDAFPDKRFSWFPWLFVWTTIAIPVVISYIILITTRNVFYSGLSFFLILIFCWFLFLGIIYRKSTLKKRRINKIFEKEVEKYKR